MKINIYEYISGKTNLTKSYLVGIFDASGSQKEEYRVMVKGSGKRYICVQSQVMGDFGSKQEIIILEYKSIKVTKWM